MRRKMMRNAMANVQVRQAVLADLETLVPLFDAYRQFYGRESEPSLAVTVTAYDLASTSKLGAVLNAMAPVAELTLNLAESFPLMV